MDIHNYLDNSLLECYALGELDLQQTADIDYLISTSLELGEALERTYIRLEQQGQVPVH